MNIIVTGGAGYIGSHAVRQLKREGYHPIIVDNLVYGHREFSQGCPLEVGDIGDKAFMASVFERYSAEAPIAAVMHFSAYAYVGESVNAPLKYYANNFSATTSLLEVMLNYGIRTLIFSSTCATYGEPQYTPLKETHPQQPLNPYGRSKFFVESVLRESDVAYGLRFAALRYFNASGADESAEIGEDHSPETHLIPLLLDVALGRRESITVFGNDYNTPDGTCIRDYIHVTDLADAHILALKYILNGNPSDFFNLGNGNGFSVFEVIRMVEEVTQAKITYVLGSRREGDPAVLIGSSEKAKTVLGWSPKRSDLKRIIETAWEWHKKRFQNRVL